MKHKIRYMDIKNIIDKKDYKAICIDRKINPGRERKSMIIIYHGYSFGLYAFP